MRYSPTVNDESLKNGLVVSVGLHVSMFAFLFFGLPHLVPPLPAHHGPVPFDIVTIGEITNTRIGNDEAKPSPPPAASAPRSAPVPPAPPKAKTEVPTPKAPDVKVEAEAIEALKPKPMEKPKPPAAEKQAPPQDLLGSVLKDVAKLKTERSAENIDQKADAKNTPQSSSTSGSGTAASGFGPALSSRLSITEEDALRRQVEQCWNPPVGARDARNLVVEVMIDVNADRTVASADIVDKGRYASDPFFRAAADAAVRALRNPKCNPLELAPDKYEQWKRIDFTFDPRDML